MYHRDHKDIGLGNLGSIDWTKTIQDIGLAAQTAFTVAPQVASTIQLFSTKPQSTTTQTTQATQQPVIVQQPAVDNSAQMLALQQQLTAQQEALRLASQPKTTDGDNKTLLYVGIGVGALALVGIALALSGSKKDKKD